MSDLPERLRRYSKVHGDLIHGLMHEAADEVERLEMTVRVQGAMGQRIAELERQLAALGINPRPHEQDDKVRCWCGAFHFKVRLGERSNLMVQALTDTEASDD